MRSRVVTSFGMEFKSIDCLVTLLNCNLQQKAFFGMANSKEQRIAQKIRLYIWARWVPRKNGICCSKRKSVVSNLDNGT